MRQVKLRISERRGSFPQGPKKPAGRSAAIPTSTRYSQTVLPENGDDICHENIKGVLNVSSATAGARGGADCESGTECHALPVKNARAEPWKISTSSSRRATSLNSWTMDKIHEEDQSGDSPSHVIFLFAGALLIAIFRMLSLSRKREKSLKTQASWNSVVRSRGAS